MSSKVAAPGTSAHPVTSLPRPGGNPTVKRVACPTDSRRPRGPISLRDKNTTTKTKGPTVNVAARMGSWSAYHRKTAIIGWLLFVVAAVVIGSSGTKQITNAEGSNGQTAKAERVLTSSGFPNAASENVLVQTKNGRSDDVALRSAVTQVIAAVSSTKLVD